MITRFAIIAPHQNYLHGFFGRILSVPLSIFQKTPPIYTRPLWLDTVSVGMCVCVCVLLVHYVRSLLLFTVLWILCMSVAKINLINVQLNSISSVYGAQCMINGVLTFTVLL